MKRALADVLLFLGATAVVFLGVALLVILFQSQTNLAQERAYIARASSFMVEFVNLDEQAIASSALFVGLVIVVMTRLICQLPRRNGELVIAAANQRQTRRKDFQFRRDLHLHRHSLISTTHQQL